MKVKLKDIAEKTGFSINTVSRALRDDNRISSDTRSTIQTVSKDLEYIPNFVAGSMRSNRTNIIGVISADSSNPFFAEVLLGIEDTARKNNYHILLMNTEEKAENEREAIVLLQGRQVDGLIVIPVFNNIKNRSMYQKLKIPYAFARIEFRGKTLLFWMVMAGMMIPFQVLVIPLYLQFNTYGMLNTLASVSLPRLAILIGIFILKQFYEGIPLSLEEAPFIDGAGRFRIFMMIILPLGKAAMATVIILSFITGWNDFLWPLIAISDTAKYTITVGIANFQGTHGTEYSLIMAGAFIASIPQFLSMVFSGRKLLQESQCQELRGNINVFKFEN